MKAELLLKIARDAIQDTLYDSQLLNKEALRSEMPALNEKAATFVTLTINDDLRGCIGTIISHRTLLEDLISNARSAAFHDPRFAPLTEDEFQDVHMEVSLLTTPLLCSYQTTQELKQKVSSSDGVIIKSNHNQATFLPQVWEQLPTFELFFEHLCTKAGMKGDCLDNHPEVYLYQVEKFKE